MKILAIIVCIYVGFVLVWLVALGLHYILNFSKPLDFIISVVYLKDTLKKIKAKKESKKRKLILANGTANEQVAELNKDDASYQLLTDEEVKIKYEGLDFNKVEIVLQPNFLYNIDTKKINDFVDKLIYLKSDGTLKDVIIQPPIPKGNRNVSVQNYSFSKSEWEDEVKKLNTYKKIAIYRHKVAHYRYIVLDNIK